MAETKLKVQKREESKISILNQNRKKGLIPGVLYGHNVESTPIFADEMVMRALIYTSEARVINLTIEGEENSYSCILKHVQFEPLKNRPIHFDLFSPKEGEKISHEVNVIRTGNAAGIKEGGILQHSLHKLEIECLPQNIPPHIEVEISGLSIGDSVRVSDIKLEGIDILNDANASIASVVPPTIEKTAETAAETTDEGKSSEPEVISKGKKEEEE